MINCKRCNQEMADTTNYCPTCGEDQRDGAVTQQKSNSTFLLVLCILTIVGSLFTIGRAYIYELVSMIDDSHFYYRGYIYMGTSVGTLVGAIMMLNKKLMGLYVYTIFQVIYIITVIVASGSYGDAFDGSSIEHGSNPFDGLAVFIALVFLVPSIAFLVMYWTNMIKKHLN